MAFLKIDKALGEYYAALGQSDYYDKDNVGKFFKFCKENGFEEDDIDEEFANQPADCMYPDFDEYFPLKPAISDDDARQSEIFRIIKYCYDNGTSPISNKQSSHYNVPKDILDIVIETDKKTQKECDKLYKLQCPLLYKEEDVLKRCFSVSIKNNRYPFLINLVDSYLRDKALYQFEKHKDLQMVKWRKKSRYFLKMDKEQKKMADTLASGVETYLRRGCTSWDYGPSKLGKIQDSIQDISLYIFMANNFVANIINQYDVTTPFQIDFPIALNKIKKLRIGSIGNDDDSDIEISDDSDDDGSENKDEDDEKYIDKIGDVTEKLQLNKLPYYTFEMKKNLKDTAVITRCINDGFNKFKDRLSTETYYKKHSNELKNYPSKKRFCCFIDRRLKPDKITIFEPPSNCSNIPKGNVPEWYFNATKTCIIPGKPDNGQPDNKETIKADSNVDGQIITISFQVEAQDIIKVYMFWMARYTRIYPQDLQSILPDIFDMNTNNNKQWTIKQSQQIAKKMNIFTDNHYESFYRQVSYKKHIQFPKQYN